jgi:hypothetical protein
MEQFTNNASSTLNGTITSGAGSLIVTSATGFPTSGNFRIIVDQEIMLVTAVSGPNFTISRAQESTLAAAHTNGVAVAHVITAGGLAQTIRDHGDAFGTAANRPTAAGLGYTYWCTDIPVAYFDDPGTTQWKQFATEYMPAPAAASSYTVAGPATANLSLTQWADTIRVTSISNSGVGCVAVAANSNLGATQSWGVTLVATLNPFQNATNGSEFGIALTNGTTSGTSTGRVFDFIHGITGNTTNIGFEIDSFTVGTGRSGSGITSSLGYPLFIGGTGRIHMRALADGANIHYQISTDGFHWMDVYSEATPSGFTNYGFMLGYDNTGANSGSYAQALVYENNVITPTQYNITAATNGSPSVITIGTHSIQAGDVVSIHGVVGATGLNTGTGSGSLAGGVIVTAITSTTISTTVNTPGVWSSGGVVTIISR